MLVRRHAVYPGMVFFRKPVPTFQHHALPRSGRAGGHGGAGGVDVDEVVGPGAERGGDPVAKNSFVIRLDTFRSTSYGKRAQSAVIASVLSTTRSAIT